MMTDNFSVLEVLPSMSITTEKRLNVDQKSVLESYHRMEIGDMTFFLPENCIANSLKKSKILLSTKQRFSNKAG